MARNIFPLKPLAKTLDTSYPAINQDPLATSWPTLNVQVDSNRIKRRWDYTSELALPSGSVGQYATLYKRGTGVTNTLFLTETGLFKKAGTSTEKITDGGLEIWASATNLTSWTETLSGTSTVNRETSSVHGGTYAARIDIDSSNNYAFIATAMTLTASGQYRLSFWYKTAEGKTCGFLLQDSGNNVYLNPALEWQAGASQIVLPAATTYTKYNVDFTAHASYTAYVIALGRVTDASAASSSIYIDDVSVETGDIDNLTPTPAYTMPTDERWQFSVVNDVFCFTNGAVNVQKWDGAAATATDLDATNAVKARYCTCYANRLILADMYLSAVRQPWTIKWSKEGDATDWTDSTAGEADFADTSEPITGLARVGNNLVVFKKNAYYIGSRTGTPTAPFSFPTCKSGVGNWAPYSIVEAAGTCFWMGHDNFYVMNGEEWEPIGNAIKYEFFSRVNDKERVKVWGVANPRYNEVLWFAMTNEGQRVFSFKFSDNAWSTYSLPSLVTGFSIQ